jgi:hypothetical protein
MRLIRMAGRCFHQFIADYPEVTIFGKNASSSIVKALSEGSAVSKLAWVNCMTTKLEIGQEPFSTATVAVILREIRHLAGHLSACDTAILASADTHRVIMQALESLRTMAGCISLDKALEDNHTRHLRLLAARPGGEGLHVIDIGNENSSDSDVASIIDLQSSPDHHLELSR